MATVRVFPVASTQAGTPRLSAALDYDGSSDKSVVIKPVCPTWDTANPAIVVDLAIQQSFDDGATWADFARLSTPTRKRTRTGDMPSMTCQVVDGLGARKVRAVLSVSTASLNIGADATV